MALLHLKSMRECHQESVEVMIALSQTTKNIGELMSQPYAIQKMENRDALLCIIRYIKFLCRQGLALRGGGDGLDRNLYQLLLKAEHDPNLAEWLQRKENDCTNPDIQNELIKTLGIYNFARPSFSSPELTLCIHYGRRDY